MQSEAKKRSEKMQGCGRKNSGVDFLRGGSFVYCDIGEDIDLVRFHVYLRREEIGEKEELFQIRYQDGDIILDGINGKR